MDSYDPASHQLGDAPQRFCDDFSAGHAPRIILGRNDYAASIIEAVPVDAVIDEFTAEKTFMGVPIISLQEAPTDAMVVSVVIGKPLMVKDKLDKSGLRHLDYFAFSKLTALPVRPVKFWPRFIEDFDENRQKYEELLARMADAGSRQTLESIVAFRLTSNLECMRDFEEAQDRQYFEPFLALEPEGESFADVGCFDGYTTQCFIRLCPGYRAIHVFEPDSTNMDAVKQNLGQYENIHYHPFGLSDRSQTLSFISSGSTSRIAEDGDITIQLKAYDEAVNAPVSFIKMDIEGGECQALAGLEQTIRAYHPRLAISAYHRFDDLWRIPEQVLAYRDDYRLYLRHYTEGVDETVMFFIPV